MGKISILIVEDETIVSADLSMKLERLGYQVAGTASGGREAVDMAVRLKPQLILMDIQLDGPLDGIETAMQIQAVHKVPVIYLTAHSDPATLSRAKLTGPFGYILKPFEDRDLATQIELSLYKHQADQKLHEQRRWLHGTLNSIGDGVIATDAQGCVTFLNPVAQDLTGWSQDEAVGKPVEQVFSIVNEHSRAVVDDPTRMVLETGNIVGLANHTVLLRKNGGEVPIDDSGAPIHDENGDLLGVVLVFRDISERKRVLAALQRSQERLKKAQQIAHLGGWEFDVEKKGLTWSDEVYLRGLSFRRASG